MFLTIKEVIFFCLLLTTLLLTCYYTALKKQTNPILLSLSSLLMTLVLVLIYKYGRVCKCAPTPSKDTFHFEVSKPKLCHGWPYMQSSASPELQTYCKKLFSTPEGVDEYESMTCPSGYSGRPVTFERTDMSNSKWENEMCNPTLPRFTYPKVL